VLLPQRVMFHADTLCLSVAAASIIAKVTRDHLMVKLDTQYPGYGLAQHKGYGTQIHQQALAQLGPSAIHRMTFEPVRVLSQSRDYDIRHTMQIRAARIEDSAGIARVQVDSYRTAYAGILPPAYLAHFTYKEQEQDWRDLLSSEQHDSLCVAETDAGEIVGYALGRPGQSTIAPYESELVALHVRHSYQRQGIGRQLVTAIAERLRQQACSSLMLWVLAENPSRLFYERLGGQLVGRQTIRLGEGNVSAVEVAYGWSNIESLCAQSGTVKESPCQATPLC
jgi:ribosomal protein S18 acetylase RimI-like enzyme